MPLNILHGAEFLAIKFFCFVETCLLSTILSQGDGSVIVVEKMYKHNWCSS
jgi:hypothetical protein